MAGHGHLNGSKFRTTVWDPWLILSQIAAMQSCYYTLLSFSTLLAEAFSGQDIALAHILDYRIYRGDTVFGWTLGLGSMACAMTSIFLLVRIVERARLCLDFVVTLHIVHLVFTTFYSGHIPTTVFWWALHLASCCVMSVGGEWACMQREMEPILLSGGSATNVASSRTNGTEAHATANRFLSTIDEDDIFHREVIVDIENGGSDSGMTADDKRKGRLLNEGYDGDNDTEYDDDEMKDGYGTEEDRAKSRLSNRIGAISQRVARVIGDKKRKQSGVSYEMIPQVRVTSATSMIAGQPSTNRPERP
ncbi:integral membrane protein S linking to the trans Golgi network-domain-containing protein [Syncephalis fuscata]|nr:integral membrane protein S linking to the trans Golgi network-domain-containing protein [Syncephalis fuscata]